MVLIGLDRGSDPTKKGRDTEAIALTPGLCWHKSICWSFNGMARSVAITILSGIVVLMMSANSSAQSDEICREFGETPTREVDGRTNRLASYVFGRIILKGVAAGQVPRVVAVYSDMRQPATRQLIGRSGSYCFRRMGTGAMLVIEVDGIESARKSISDIGAVRQREDFEILVTAGRPDAPPGVISTKFSRPPNEKTTELYRKAADAEASKDAQRAIEFVKEIIALDPEDFVAWAKLGSLHLADNQIADAEAAFKRAIAARPDYTPALLNIGIILAVRKQFPDAIDAFKRAVISDPSSARAYRLLGEAYLQNRQGTMGLAALDEALRIDPVGMAECHLLKARLYDLAGAKALAAQEYKAFLAKVPDHPDKKAFQNYIKSNINAPSD